MTVYLVRISSNLKFKINTFNKNEEHGIDANNFILKKIHFLKNKQMKLLAKICI